MTEAERTEVKHRILKGTVVATAMNKTATILVQSKKRHPKYEKIIKRSKKYLIHDEKGELRVGDFVAVRECRPISKRKSFKLHEILERAK